MKGIVFTEFIEMVEEKYSCRVVDSLLDSTTLESGGAYTAVGTYDHEELLRLVSALSDHSGIDAPNLVRAFGYHLLNRFSFAYPEYFEFSGVFDFLEAVDGVIHVEVQKLYPDAELPGFKTQRNGNTLEMEYHSPRGFSDLAHGLINGAIDLFGEEADLEQMSCDKGTKFVITQRSKVLSC